MKLKFYDLKFKPGRECYVPTREELLAMDKKKRVSQCHIAVRKAFNNSSEAPKKCCVCGMKPGPYGQTIAHHEDYLRPMRVAYLCRSHHRMRHVELRRKGINP